MARSLNSGRAANVSMADFNERVRMLLATKAVVIKPERQPRTKNWNAHAPNRNYKIP